MDRINYWRPDVGVITEFRGAGEGGKLKSWLAENGYPFLAQPDCEPKLNSLLIFSRTPLEVMSRPCAPALAHRIQEVRVCGLSIVAFYFPLGKEKAPLFDWILEHSPSWISGRAALIGDFNTGKHRIDEVGATFVVPRYLDELEKLGWVDAWRHRNGSKREYTWYSRTKQGFRIDHLFVSPGLLAKLHSCSYSHLEREEKLSDHSLLWAELKI